jgi:hypothetical protein
MALRYFGVEKGANGDTVTQGSSTTSKTVEVVVDLADGADKGQVLVALEYIKNEIIKNIWPPA